VKDGVDLLHGIFNQIYETGELPDDFLTSVFISLPKKPGAVDDTVMIATSEEELQELLESG